MLSRNLYSKSQLARDLTHRYRVDNTSRSTGVTDAARLRQQLNSGIDKNTPQSQRNNDNLIKQQLLRDHDKRKEDILLKRQKFSPYEDSLEVSTPSITSVCQLVDTGFEGDCDYYGNLYLLGDYFILENFETRTDDDIGGELFNVSLFKYVEDFEDSIALGDVWDMAQNPPLSGTIG